MSPEKRDGNIRDYCEDFTFQAVKELLQFALVSGHLDIESMHPVFHLTSSFLGLDKAWNTRQRLISIAFVSTGTTC